MITKKKKEIMPWRQGIFKGHTHKPSRAQRAEFPYYVVADLKKESKGVCQVCLYNRCTQTHHIMPRSRSGRGVKKNGLRICNDCHKVIHSKNSELNKWIEKWVEKYGDNFWYDEIDIEYNKLNPASTQ